MRKKAKAAKPKPERQISGGWKKVLAGIGKKGKAGANSEEIAKLCKQHGVRPWFARFVRAGYLARIERGVYRLTAAGAKAIGG